MTMTNSHFDVSINHQNGYHLTSMHPLPEMDASSHYRYSWQELGYQRAKERKQDWKVIPPGSTQVFFHFNSLFLKILHIEWEWLCDNAGRICDDLNWGWVCFLLHFVVTLLMLIYYYRLHVQMEMTRKNGHHTTSITYQYLPADVLEECKIFPHNKCISLSMFYQL